MKIPFEQVRRSYESGPGGQKSPIWSWRPGLFESRLIDCFLVCDLRFSGDNTFLVDDKFSLADVVLATLLSMAVVIGQYDLSKKFPKLQNFYDGVLKQPAYAKIQDKLMAFLTTDEMQARMKNRKRVTKF